MVCVNGDGTEKLPLVFIGNSRMRKCFNRQTGNEHDFNYILIQNLGWALPFLLNGSKNSIYILREQEIEKHSWLSTTRRALELRIIYRIYKYSNYFLPLRTASKLQPLYSGIIAKLKSNYRRRRVNLALGNSERESKKFCDVDQLTAMKWMKKIWEELKEEIIFNFWINTGLIASCNSVLKTQNMMRTLKLRQLRRIYLMHCLCIFIRLLPSSWFQMSKIQILLKLIGIVI